MASACVFVCARCVCRKPASKKLSFFAHLPSKVRHPEFSQRPVVISTGENNYPSVMDSPQTSSNSCSSNMPTLNRLDVTLASFCCSQWARANGGGLKLTHQVTLASEHNKTLYMYLNCRIPSIKSVLWLWKDATQREFDCINWSH